MKAWLARLGRVAAVLRPLRGGIARAGRIAAALVVVAALGVLGGGAVIGYYALRLPLPDSAVAVPRQASFTLVAADGAPMGGFGAVKGEVLRLDELPAHLVRAVLAIEDRRFWEHHGVDVYGIARAAWANLRAGMVTEGASTVTQQLARTLYLSQKRTYERKLQEVLIAVWLERRMTKERILESYLNSIYFGAGAWGVDGAARRYFGKSARDLDLAESAMLAGLIRAPSTYSPVRDAAVARRRAGVVLDAMVAAGWLDPAAAEAARNRPLRLARDAAAPSGWRHFADWAGGEAAGLLNPAMPPSVVQTTLDPDLQAAAERVVRQWIEREGRRSRVEQAALVAMTPEGTVLAMVGGVDYDASQFNRAVQSRRQAGSLFKLFVYAAALQGGYAPDSVLIDQPVRVGAWAPENYDNFYRGPVDLRTAFAQSINSVAVQLASAVGWGRVAEVARSMGITSPLPPVPALSLGAADVSLLEMTAAYAAVAADRQRVRPRGLHRIVAGDRVIELRPAAAPPPSWNRAQLLDLLAAVMREGTGTGSALARPSAGKTGTSQDYRDAWFVGFTADVVVGVWVGNDDNSPMEGITGAKLPAQIWHDFMVAADSLKRDPRRRRDLDLPPAAARLEVQQYASLDPQMAATAPMPTVTLPPSAAAAEVAGMARPAEGELRGVPVVLDTGTLSIDGQMVRLHGVAGSGRFVEQMQRFIAGREVRCTPVAGGRYRCEVGGRDLSRVVIYNGGARSTVDAPAPYGEAEREARVARRGLWGG